MVCWGLAVLLLAAAGVTLDLARERRCRGTCCRQTLPYTTYMYVCCGPLYIHVITTPKSLSQMAHFVYSYSQDLAHLPYIHTKSDERQQCARMRIKKTVTVLSTVTLLPTSYLLSTSHDVHKAHDHYLIDLREVNVPSPRQSLGLDRSSQSEVIAPPPVFRKSITRPHLLLHTPYTTTTMPARLNLFATPRALAHRPRQSLQSTFSAAYRLQQPVCRSYSSNPSKDLPTADKAETVGPNMEQQEHVSEEAAKMAKMTGGEGPDLTQGTPVQDVCCNPKSSRTSVTINLRFLNRSLSVEDFADVLYSFSKTTKKPKSTPRKC